MSEPADVTREWLHDRRIVVYTVFGIRRPVLDAWSAMVTHDLLAWPTDRPYLSLHDYSHVVSIAATPYLRQHAAKLVQLNPTLSGRTAVVLHASVPWLFSTAQGLLESLRRGGGNTRERRFFMDYDTALVWLEDVLHGEEPAD